MEDKTMKNSERVWGLYQTFVIDEIKRQANYGRNWRRTFVEQNIFEHIYMGAVMIAERFDELEKERASDPIGWGKKMAEELKR